MRIHASFIICSLVLLCGCSSERLSQGHGDAGQFILQHAIAYGGHPIATNSLPAIGGRWRYVQDEYGTAVHFPASRYQAAQNFVRAAFGPPSNWAGWSVRDFGVAIMVQTIGSNAVVTIMPPMSYAKQDRMFQRMLDDMNKKDSR